MQNKIVITGISLISSLGLNLNENLSKLKKGISGLTKVESFKLKGISNNIAGEIKEFKNIKKDKWLLIFKLLTENLICDNIIDFDLIKQSTISIGSSFFGIENNKYNSIKTIIKKISKDYKINENKIYMNSNTCAAGNFAVFNGINLLKNNKTDIAICIGIDILSPYLFAGFDALKSLSKSCAKPFSTKRDGLSLGEGGAILVLERLEHALKRKAIIYCEYGGFGATNDTDGLTSMDKSCNGIIQCYKKALENSKIKKNQIDYILAHGTGTIVNDNIEGGSIKKFFNNTKIGFFKHLFGHTLGASSLIEAVLLALLINKNFTLKCNKVIKPEFDLNFTVKNEKTNIIYGINNSFGFGGINSSLILKKYLEK